MRLLVVTQAMDSEDPVLGFFVRWVEEFAKRFEHIDAVCLKEGKHELPRDVRVHSLGKERGRPRLGPVAYALRFLRLAWRLRREYDAVFVHMNQEYVLLGGVLWKLSGKRIYLWRNHYAGSWKTDLAAVFCARVFCTSSFSYTAKYSKTVLMPVGVDTVRFKPDTSVSRTPRSILFLARMAPSKRPELLLEALAMLAEKRIDFSIDFVGSPLPEHEAYYGSLQERTKAFGDHVRFLPGISNKETPHLYQSHEIFVNTSPSGMLDKTIFEAAACGCRTLAVSEDWRALAGEDAHFDTAMELAEKLKTSLGASSPVAVPPPLVAAQSLEALSDRLLQELSVTLGAS